MVSASSSPTPDLQCIQNTCSKIPTCNAGTGTIKCSCSQSYIDLVGACYICSGLGEQQGQTIFMMVFYCNQQLGPNTVRMPPGYQVDPGWIGIGGSNSTGVPIYTSAPIPTFPSTEIAKVTSTPINGNAQGTQTTNNPTLPLPVIIGGGVGGVIIIALVTALFFVLRRRKQPKRLSDSDTPPDMTNDYYLPDYPKKSDKSDKSNKGNMIDAVPLTTVPAFDIGDSSPASTLVAVDTLKPSTQLSGQSTPPPPFTIRPTNASTTVSNTMSKTETNRTNIYSQFSTAATIYSQPDAAAIVPSARAGTTMFARYKLTAVTHRGGVNIIRQGIDEQTGIFCALKWYRSAVNFEIEVVMLKYLRSPYVVEIQSLYQLPERQQYEDFEGLGQDFRHVLVMPYYEQSLDVFIRTKLVGKDQLYYKLIIKEMAQGIEWCHNHGIAHLDIKPGNFVRDGNDGTWRLCDFETARFIGEEYVTDLTPLYAAPELMRSAYGRGPIKASAAMDMWSLGCIIWELYTRNPVFASDEEAARILTDENNVFELQTRNISDPQARHVLSKLLVVQPRSRMAIGELLNGAYLNWGLDTRQQDHFAAKHTQRIIDTIETRTDQLANEIQASTEAIMSQLTAIQRQLVGLDDARVPRLFMVLPHNEMSVLPSLDPRKWGKNIFILRLLCEGAALDNSAAHFTNDTGYTIMDPKPFLRKAGPFLSVVTLFACAAAGHALHLTLPADTIRIIGKAVWDRPTEYFEQLSKVLDEHGMVTKADSNDRAYSMQKFRGPALRELAAFLEANDPARRFGGLFKVTFVSGHVRWLCRRCTDQVDPRLYVNATGHS